MAHILIVDDNEGIRSTLKELVEGDGHTTTPLMTAEDALICFKKNEPDLVLLDIGLPGMTGFDLLEKIKVDNNPIPVVMITSHNDTDSTVRAMRLGAYDYVTKPFNLDQISITVRKALQSKQREEHLAYLKRNRMPLGFDNIVGNSPQIQKIFNLIRQVSSSPSTPVLIRGETGTGKELVAQAIHQNSQRHNHPFIEVNCSAFQETLLEAEFFGYESGAFTGATSRKKGLLELAHNGTFFMDEIGDMTQPLQSKILKVLENQTFRRLGATDEIKIDTRLLSATSRDLEELIREKKFRSDLFYRLNVATITLPPLREREGDVILLAEHFLNQYSKEFKKTIIGFKIDAIDKMENHNWPGNVRELKNTIERAVLFEQSDYISADHMNFYKDPGNESFSDIVKKHFPTQGYSLEMLEKV